METENSKHKYPFAIALNKFLTEINGLSNSLPIIMQSLREARRKSIDEINQFLKEHAELQETIERGQDNNKERAEVYRISVDNHYNLQHLSRASANFTAATIITPKSFLVGMVSQFDAFLGMLIKAMYYAKPEMLNASEKQLTFANLIQFGSVDIAREYILEKEVELVLRESHTDHFDWLEKKLGITLRKGLDVWPAFVELTERRNLFVHTDGEVSSQYISVCEKCGVNLEDGCKVNTRLDVSREYFQQAYEILFEISTKLAHVIWRKLIPSESFEADGYLNSVCYDLLKEENYNLAKKMLSFAVSLPRHHSQRTNLVFIVNSAIAYKWGGEQEKANKIISETDWSACSDDFQLASAVLMERFDEAAEIMKKIGAKGSVNKADYKDWPVFRDFRQASQFLEAYKEVFGEILETIKVADNSESNNQNEEVISVTNDKVFDKEQESVG